MTSEGSARRRTHLEIDRRLCGDPVAIETGRAVVEWTGGPESAADDRGLVHGGFIFGLADYAAMLAVNEPTVVLVAAQSRFRRPVRIGERLSAEAVMSDSRGSRHQVDVTVRRDGEIVMSGTFDCVVTPRHVLEPAP